MITSLSSLNILLLGALDGHGSLHGFVEELLLLDLVGPGGRGFGALLFLFLLLEILFFAGVFGLGVVLAFGVELVDGQSPMLDESVPLSAAEIKEIC